MIYIAILIFAYCCWRIYFLRNPKRNIPHGPVAVSPADGYVVYIKRVQAGEMPISIKNERKIQLSELSGIEEMKHCSGVLIGIFMSPASVHRNRVPLTGKIVFQKHHKNQLNLTMVRRNVELYMHRQMKDDPENKYLLTNERFTTGIQTEKGTYFLTQIADPWINRIVSWVKQGDSVEKGEQYGMIRFGSQVDLLLPDSLGVSLKIKEGQYVYAGETILGVTE